MLTDGYGFRYQYGYAKASYIDDPDCIVRAVWLHYVLYHPHAELEQLRRGLYSTLQFKHLIQSHPKELWGLLATSTVLMLFLSSSAMNLPYSIPPMEVTPAQRKKPCSCCSLSISQIVANGKTSLWVIY